MTLAYSVTLYTPFLFGMVRMHVTIQPITTAISNTNRIPIMVAYTAVLVSVGHGGSSILLGAFVTETVVVSHAS